MDDQEFQSQDGQRDQRKSRFRPVDIPIFESKIPSHLLSRLKEEEVWLYGVLSKLEQSVDWFKQSRVEEGRVLVEFDLEVSKEIRALSQRLHQLEQWRAIFSVRWALLISIAIIIFSGLSGAIFKLVLERWVSSKDPVPHVIYVPVPATNSVTTSRP